VNRLVCGIILGTFGLLCLVSAGHSKHGPASSVVIGLLFLTGGGLLIFFGSKYLKQKKTVAEFALQMLHKDGKIDAYEIARRLDISEVDVRVYIAEYLKKGIIPFKAEIV